MTRLLIFTLCLTGCMNWAHIETRSNIEKRIFNWRGLPDTELFKRIAIDPIQSKKQKNGNTLIIYRMELKPPEQKDPYFCQVYYEVDEYGDIVDTGLMGRSENLWGIYMPCKRITPSPEKI